MISVNRLFLIYILKKKKTNRNVFELSFCKYDSRWRLSEHIFIYIVQLCNNKYHANVKKETKKRRIRIIQQRHIESPIVKVVLSVYLYIMHISHTF